MARKGKKRRHVKAKPSVLSLIPVAYVGYNVYRGYKANGAAGALRGGISETTGIDPMGAYPFDAGVAMRSVGVLVGTWGAKKLVAMAGTNRAMRGLPFRL